MLHYIVEVLGDKVLVFSESVQMLEELGQYFRSGTALAAVSSSLFKDVPRVSFITGKIVGKRRRNVLKMLRNGYTDIVFVSSKAGGTGLNLQIANHVIIFQPR